MQDKELWTRGVKVVATECAALPPAERAVLHAAVTTIMNRKKELHRLVGGVYDTGICGTCQGACCRSGKYHVTVVDILAFLLEEEPLFVPDFEQSGCPYLGDAGCLMSPGHRPFNCITFHCEDVENLLSPGERGRCTELEFELRAWYERIEKICSGRFMNGFLLNCERDLLAGKGTFLGGCAGMAE